MLKIIPTMAESRGYHRLAEVLMGPYPEAAIFRRFGPLAMLNLLSLQAELVDLELEFRRIRSTDDTSNDPTERNFSSYFKDLHMSEGGNNARQYQLLMKIRHKLKEYCILIRLAQGRRCCSADQDHEQTRLSFKQLKSQPSQNQESQIWSFCGVGFRELRKAAISCKPQNTSLGLPIHRPIRLKRNV